MIKGDHAALTRNEDRLPNQGGADQMLSPSLNPK